MLLSYLDANSGSLIAQVAVAGFAGAAVAAKLGWRRASERLRGNREPGGPEAQADAEKHGS
jgi:hypothetical protein